MLTLQKLNAAVQQLRQKHITYAKRHRFLGAVQALSLQEFSSLNKAGRQLHINRLSGESRIRRTVNDTRLSNQLQALLIAETLGGRSGYWYCSLERFEIEESFKDLKWLNRLEWQRVRKPEVIRSLLLFVFLGWWLLWRYDGQHQKHQTQEPAKKKIGWFRMSWERLHRLSWPPELCFVT